MKTESERVYAEIYKLIQNKRYIPAQPLREAAIATELKVSRTPVREALRRLASEGVVEIIPNRGARVTDFTEEDVKDIWTLRLMLEPFAASLAAKRATPENIERLIQFNDEMKNNFSTGNLDVLTDANNKFHEEIVKATQSRVLHEAMALVRHRTLVRRTFAQYSEDQLMRSLNHHQELVDAIKAGNSNWAESTMRAHIEAGQEIR
ncbi:MAG TPA: GntR family transcriptional regulator [Microbacteriaceae bacterium]|nr:GntR family transcriptional regulator [Microbacteriaceae bacterium]